MSACARALVERDDAAPWLDLARAAADGVDGLPELASALAGSGPLVELALRLDEVSRRRTAGELTADVAAAGDALRGLSPLLTYRVVVGRRGAAESWTGRRRRERERLPLWGSPIAEGDVALLDPVGRIALSLSPAVQAGAPMPGAETELFLLWRSGRSGARLVASPWSYEREDAEATRLLADLRDQATDTSEEEDGSAAPYRGLSSYGADDAAVFVGREREVEGLLNRMVRATTIAVLGPSGVGKSSFLHAGVVARLTGEHRVISLRPGPTRSLRCPTRSRPARARWSSASRPPPPRRAGSWSISSRS